MSTFIGNISHSDVSNIRRYVDGAVVFGETSLNKTGEKFFALQKCKAPFAKDSMIMFFQKGSIVKKDGLEKFKSADNKIYTTHRHHPKSKQLYNEPISSPGANHLENLIFSASIISRPSENNKGSYQDDPSGLLGSIAFAFRLKKNPDNNAIQEHREMLAARFRLQPEETDQLMKYQLFISRNR